MKTCKILKLVQKVFDRVYVVSHQRNASINLLIDANSYKARNTIFGVLFFIRWKTIESLPDLYLYLHCSLTGILCTIFSLVYVNHYP
jgi:hypothetical protein